MSLGCTRIHLLTLTPLFAWSSPEKPAHSRCFSSHGMCLCCIRGTLLCLYCPFWPGPNNTCLTQFSESKPACQGFHIVMGACNNLRLDCRKSSVSTQVFFNRAISNFVFAQGNRHMLSAGTHDRMFQTFTDLETTYLMMKRRLFTSDVTVCGVQRDELGRTLMILQHRINFFMLNQISRGQM